MACSTLLRRVERQTRNEKKKREKSTHVRKKVPISCKLKNKGLAYVQLFLPFFYFFIYNFLLSVLGSGVFDCRLVLYGNFRMLIFILLLYYFFFSYLFFQYILEGPYEYCDKIKVHSSAWMISCRLRLK